MMTLSDADRASLLRLARDGLCRAVSGAASERPVLHGGLAHHAAAFVTLTIEGSLRGCTGALRPRLALGRLIPRLAASSALGDPRFRPLGANDVERTRIEISVLSGFERIDRRAIVPGVHGVLIERGPRRGVLLPQVAVEHRFSREDFLGAACSKAGLFRDAWRDETVEVRVFTADVFAEPAATAVPA